MALDGNNCTDHPTITTMCTKFSEILVAFFRHESWRWIGLGVQCCGWPIVDLMPLGQVLAAPFHTSVRYFVDLCKLAKEPARSHAPILLHIIRVNVLNSLQTFQCKCLRVDPLRNDANQNVKKPSSFTGPLERFDDANFQPSRLGILGCLKLGERS